VPQVLGDVVISWETAKRQAQERDEPLSEELKRLLVHGVLHLLGYDHVKGPEASDRMRAMEERYLG
jgi:probable rRNA maturation factor